MSPGRHFIAISWNLVIVDIFLNFTAKDTPGNLHASADDLVSMADQGNEKYVIWERTQRTLRAITKTKGYLSAPSKPKKACLLGTVNER